MKLKAPSQEWLERMADMEDKCQSISAGYMRDLHPWRSWFRRTFFPIKHCFAPEVEFERKDCITVHSVTKLSFVDRIRCMLTGVVVVTTRTATENEAGQTLSTSTCHIGVWSDIH